MAIDDDMAAEKRRFEEENKKNAATKKESDEKSKQDQCKIAKDNFHNFTQGGRMYKMNEKGEREFLDDKAIQDSMLKAKKEMETYCK